jgi:hypothetical protein
MRREAVQGMRMAMVLTLVAPLGRIGASENRRAAGDEFMNSAPANGRHLQRHYSEKISREAAMSGSSV